MTMSVTINIPPMCVYVHVYIYMQIEKQSNPKVMNLLEGKLIYVSVLMNLC